MDYIAQTPRTIDMAILVANVEEGFASCFIDLPAAMEGTVFTKLVRKADDFFAETLQGEMIAIPNIDSATFEMAMECGSQHFEIGSDADIDNSIRYDAEFVSEGPSYRPGV